MLWRSISFRWVPKGLKFKLGLPRVKNETIAAVNKWEWSRTSFSAAALRTLKAGGQDTWADAALLRSSLVALLLLHVLTQERPHLLLVLKRTGTETGAQPSLVLGRESKGKKKTDEQSIQLPTMSGG